MTSSRLKNIAEINRRQLPETTDPSFAFRYVDIGAVSSRGAVTVPADAISFAEAPSRARRIAPAGAVLVSTVRTYLRAIARVPRTDDPLAFSTGFAVLEARPGIDERYLYFLCRSDAVVEEVVARSTGVSYPAIDASDLGNIPVEIPSSEEQRRIADFLDDQVSGLHNAIDRVAQRRALLEEARTATLAECFSGRATGAQLYEHPILGPVPTDWPVRSLKHVCERIGVGVIVNPSSYFALEGVPFLHGGNVRDGFFDLTDVKRMSEEDSKRLDRSRLRSGDVLVVRAGYPGRSAVVTPDLAGANCASMLLIRPSPTVLSDWVSGFFNSPQGRQQVSVAQYGAAQEQINVGDVVDFQIPVPPAEVQKAQIREAHRITGDVARMASLATRQGSLLEERKQALITAAVTGQFDVTTARSVA